MTKAKARGRRKGKRRSWEVSALPTPNPTLTDRSSTWESRCADLLSIWNQCVVRANEGSRIKARVKSPNNTTLEILFGLDRWCASMGVDAGAWIVTLFEASGYRSPPSQASLFSPKWRKHYDARFGSTFADVANIVQSRRSKTERGFRPFVDLYDAAERVKQGYRARNREDLCAMSIDITYGYHADSEHCATCPRASACALTTADAARAGGAL